MTREDAILWIHEEIGDALPGDADLSDCIKLVQKRIANEQPSECTQCAPLYASEVAAMLRQHVLDFHVLPALGY